MPRYTSSFACDPAAREQLSELLSMLPPDDAWERTDRAREMLESGPLHGLGDDERLHALLAPAALSLLFEHYDRTVFAGLLARVLPDGSPGRPHMRISNRMTRTAGKTTCRQVTRSRFTLRRSAAIEIALSRPLLLAAIDAEVGVMVAGVRCFDRIDALLRVFEHELVHALMFCLGWDASCSHQTFRSTAYRLFGHRASKHELRLPPPEGERPPPANDSPTIRPGDRVRFEFRGVRHEGVVNRITKRATVLVEDENGSRYTDGGTYRKYYVPLPLLERL